MEMESLIDDFVTKIVEICDEPMDGDETEHIANQVRERLDIVFANEPARKYSQISWSAEDVLEEAEFLNITITKEQAEVVLAKGADQILEAMLEAGWFVIRELLLNEYYKEKESGNAAQRIS